MSKRKDARTRQSTRGTSKRPEMTEARIAEVKTCLQRMDDHSARAISLSKRMSSADTDQSNDLFWALAKYVENLQESVVQLDAVNPRVYPALVRQG